MTAATKPGADVRLSFECWLRKRWPNATEPMDAKTINGFYTFPGNNILWEAWQEALRVGEIAGATAMREKCVAVAGTGYARMRPRPSNRIVAENTGQVIAAAISALPLPEIAPTPAPEGLAMKHDAIETGPVTEREYVKETDDSMEYERCLPGETRIYEDGKSRMPRRIKPGPSGPAGGEDDSDWPPKPTLLLLFARKKGGANWTPIFPAQLKQFIEYGCEIRVEEVSAPPVTASVEQQEVPQA